ncbi:MAG: SLC13 family permease [Dehalococcoidia bacterium]|nr:SLC13 family permease [Dehalococcoidia bacterium]
MVRRTVSSPGGVIKRRANISAERRAVSPTSGAGSRSSRAMRISHRNARGNSGKSSSKYSPARRFASPPPRSWSSDASTSMYRSSRPRNRSSATTRASSQSSTRSAAPGRYASASARSRRPMACTRASRSAVDATAIGRTPLVFGRPGHVEAISRTAFARDAGILRVSPMPATGPSLSIERVTTDAWITLAVTVGTVALLVSDRLPPSAAMFGAVVVLLTIGVIDSEQALAGFSNPAPFTVAALYLVARAAERTGALAPAIGSMLGTGSNYRRAAARLLAPTAVSSAVLNNTPIVAMLAPTVSNWADRNGLPPSRFLMPLSFAAIAGGTATVIGTSTNIVVSGQLEASGFDAIGMFEIGMVGAPVAVLGVLLLIFLSPVLLPDRRSARREFREDSRSFVVDMVVEPGGPLDGAAVEAGGLRHLQDVFLVQIDRGDDQIFPVTPTTPLRGDDVLRFVGRAERVLDLRSMRGLASTHEEHIVDFERERGAFFEAVLGVTSPLIGRTLREAEFRSRYQAAVVAIHRSGQRINAKLGEVRLRVGDTLLLLADPGFRARWYDSREFLLISRLDQVEPRRLGKSVIVVSTIAAIVVASAVGLVSILVASLVGAVVLVASGVLTPNEARTSVDLDVIVTIASAFGLAAAMESSGLAAQVATGLVDAFSGLGDRGVLLGIVLTTIVVTEMITNNAAAVLILPIALSTASVAGLDPRGVAISVAISASASFLTPVGYQTNTMVYGPGGYRFTDYMRLGFPLTILVVVIVVMLVPIIWPVD